MIQATFPTENRPGGAVRIVDKPSRLRYHNEMTGTPTPRLLRLKPTLTAGPAAASASEPRATQAGFTLLETMVVAGMVVVLATLAIPAFTGEAKKARVESEVLPFLTEIAHKQEMYAQSRGVYASPADWLPVPPSDLNSQKRNVVIPTTWSDMRLMPPEPQVVCTFRTRAGGAITTGSFSDAALDACGLSYTPPQINWYYVLAACDTDGDGVLACFMLSSDNTQLRKSRIGE